MAEKSLGVITPNGMGPISATVNMAALTNGQAYMASSYRIQHWPNNQGKIYVGDSTLEFGSGTGVFGWLPDPSNAVYQFVDSQPAWGPIAGAIDMSTIYVDTEIYGDSVLITYNEA